MSVLAAIAVLAVLIFVHELGHFLAARLQGIYANRFSIGFGPILLKYTGKQTEYALRALPLGGFVGFPDDDPDSDIPADDPNLLRNRPILDRAIVISAGVIANLIFAYFLLVAQIGLVGVQQVQYQPGVVVDLATELSTAASRAGLQGGDIVIAVDGKELGTGNPAVKDLMSRIQTNPDRQITFQIRRDAKTIDVSVIPEANKEGKGQIGVRLSPDGEVLRTKAKSPFAAFVKGAEAFEKLVYTTFDGLRQIVGNFQQTASQVAGPIKIVEIGANIAKSDAGNLFQFAALISINLAVMNILPLPALDGGQLVFLAIEALLGKPLPLKIQETVMQTGLALLLGLGVFLIVRDTSNLDSVQQLFK
jgi:membrane-associated protease RseP (regulator of RpoE activity)